MASTRTTDLGLLVLRLGLGSMFLYHGWPKVSGGPETWAKVGAATGQLGFHAIPTVMGALAAASEFGGAILLITGLFVRPAAFFMLCTMFVAASMHLGNGDGLATASHAIEDGVAFLSLLIAGGGAFSLDRRLRGR